MTTLRDLTPLLGELNDWKRLRTARSARSLTEQLFSRAWKALIAGQPVGDVALAVASEAVSGVRLGGIDDSSLREGGLATDAIQQIRLRSLRAVLSGDLWQELERGLGIVSKDGDEPAFVQALCQQPRAGATSPGRARMVLWPPESHGDHCGTVAVYAVLIAPLFESQCEEPFLAGLAHHLHNAYLADGGFAGEEMLGQSLHPVMDTLRAKALSQMPGPLRTAVCDSLQVVSDAESPEGRTFQAADVIDRVLQMRWYEQAAQFRLRTAMEDLDLVHAGPVQQLQLEILKDAGLW